MKNKNICEKYRVNISLLPTRGGHHHEISKLCNNVVSPIPYEILSKIILNKIKLIYNYDKYSIVLVYRAARRMRFHQFIDLNNIAYIISKKLLIQVYLLEFEKILKNKYVVETDKIYFPLTLLPSQVSQTLKSLGAMMVADSILTACPRCIAEWIVDIAETSKI